MLGIDDNSMEDAGVLKDRLQRKERKMTLYEKLFDLKYRKGISTFDLAHRFPNHIERVSEVALLEVPPRVLRKVVPEKSVLERLMSLKKKFPKRS